MCAICNTYPCSERCPNAPEAEIVNTCAVTGDDIYECDEYLEINGEAVSKDGIKSMNIMDLTEITGMTIEEILIELGGERKGGEAY